MRKLSGGMSFFVVGAVALALSSTALAVVETFDGFAGGTLLSSIGGGGVWWTEGAHAVVADGGVAGSNGIGTETSGSYILNWQGQPFQWSALASNDTVAIGLDFQSSPAGTFDDDRVGWTIDAASNTRATNQLALQLDTTEDGGMVCFWDSNRTVLNALDGIKPSTWYRFQVRFTKLGDTRAAIQGVLTELDASGNPTNTPYVGMIADSSEAPYSAPASRFTSASQYPSFKNYRNTAGNADNAFFAIEPGKADYVIVISVDGMGSAYVTPLLASGLANELVNIKSIMNEGAGTLNARCDYNYAVTLPNHVTMITSRGVEGPDGHGWISNSDPDPYETLESNKGSYVGSGFGVAHDAGLRTGIWAGKSRFSLFQQSYSATTGALDTNGVDNGRDKIDYDLIFEDISAANITTDFTNQMTVAPCHFAFLHYQDPDATGHASGWSTDPNSAFAATLKDVDNAIGVILQMIENSPDLAGRTAVILTADHGGHSWTHGDTSNPLDFTVPFYVWGRGVSAGADLYAINPDSRDAPGASEHPDYTGAQPVRDGDAANLALDLLGLVPIPGSTINANQDLAVYGEVVEGRSGFTAYNDCSASGSNPANTTQYRGDGTTSGYLKDFDTGTVLPVTLTITADQVGYNGLGGLMPNSGTDAYNVFDGKVVFDDTVWYNNNPTWWMEATFTGLDPTKEYEFVTSANRNDNTYTGRFTKFTISGVDSCLESSTPGVDVISNNCVRFCTGYNTVNGYVARWTKIRCGEDGTFTVRAEDGAGADPGKSYAFDGIMLRETNIGPIHIDSIVVVDASVSLSWSGPHDKARIEQTDSLTEPAWTTVSGATNLQDSAHSFGRDPAVMRRFYRVVAE